MKLKNWFKSEEKLNSFTHLIGTILSILATVLLLRNGIEEKNFSKIISFGIYGLCMITMFLTSTIYHYIDKVKLKRFLRVFDHSAIFLFIAGTYTPILFLAIKNNMSKISLVLIWIITVLGILDKIKRYRNGSFNKNKKFSLGLYLVMGWLSILFIPQMVKNIGLQFFLFILLGGILYSIGAYFYNKNKLKFSHAIWHLFINLAVISHFIAIYKYL